MDDMFIKVMRAVSKEGPFEEEFLPNPVEIYYWWYIDRAKTIFKMSGASPEKSIALLELALNLLEKECSGCTTFNPIKIILEEERQKIVDFSNLITFLANFGDDAAARSQRSNSTTSLGGDSTVVPLASARAYAMQLAKQLELEQSIQGDVNDDSEKAAKRLLGLRMLIDLTNPQHLSLGAQLLLNSKPDLPSKSPTLPVNRSLRSQMIQAAHRSNE